MKHVKISSVDRSVLELIELANVNSPYASQLVNRYCVRLARRLLKSGKIDGSMARYLCRDFSLKSSSRGRKDFLVN